MKITCLGSGAFSVAIASLLAQKKESTIYMWSHDEKWVTNTKKQKKMTVGSISTTLEDNITITTSYEEAIKDTDMIFILTNSKYIQDIVNELKYYSLKKVPIIIGTKGILETKPYFFSTYVKRALKHHKLAYFAGPNLASDLVNMSPSIVTVATKSSKVKKKMANIFPNFIKLEYTREFSVVELSSILKNVYAIGAGMLYEKYPYSSTLLSYASLANKELAHILYDKYDFEDLEMYAGITGDFFLTNTMLESRNFTYGQKYSSNKTLANTYLKTNTVEGYSNIEAIISYLKENKYPILTSIYNIIYKNEKTDILFDICFKKN